MIYHIYPYGTLNCRWYLFISTIVIKPYMNKKKNENFTANSDSDSDSETEN